MNGATYRKKEILSAAIGRINRGNPELETFNSNIAHNQPAPCHL